MQSPERKIILITGATDGLGKLVAQNFAKAGSTLLLHGRDLRKGKATVQEIQSMTANQNIHYYNADLASMQEVESLGAQILDNHERLDVLINNAAVGGGPKGSSKRELSKDGYELRFAVNYLSHFFLTLKLLPLIKKSSASRIVFVSSIGQSPIDFNDLMMEKKYDSFTAYCRSKLAMIMFGFELALQLKDAGIIVNSLHPATLMPTNMVYDYFGYTSGTIEEGAKVVEYVAVSPETKNVSGAYFNQMKEAQANSQAYDTEARRRLWELSEGLAKKHFQTNQ